jgi:8-hydroxy-5-deazaflavin:NADPH oxidoreductase
MNVGILGSGAVAKALGRGFMKHGHRVMFGTREASKLADVATQMGATVGTFAEAARFGEVLVLAVKGSAAEEVLRLAGPGIAGKIIMDPTNPIASTPPINGVLSLFTSSNESLMERLQRAFPSARFVKAFSSIGNARMVNPTYAEGRPTMFICGADEASKHVVSGICDAFGWEVLDLGGVEAARAIEPLCILWCIPGFRQNEWTHAFKVLHG